MIRSPLQTRGDLLASRLWQAALTYPQRWAFRISGGLLLITLAAIGCIAPVSELSRSIWGLIVIVQIAYGSTFITVHLKQQLDDWRSSITPNFRPTHFVVAGFILSLIVVGVPLLLCAPLGEHVKAFVAAAIVVAALCAWTVYDPLLVLLLVPLFFTIIRAGLSTTIASETPQVVTHVFDLFPWSTICGGVGLTAVLWTCFGRLNGESEHRQDRPIIAAGVGVGPVSFMAGRLLQWISNAVSNRMANRRSAVQPLGGKWSRIRHRRRATAEGMSPMWAGALSSGLVVAIVAAIKFFFMGNSTTPDNMACVLGVCPMAVPLLCAGSIWPRRWSYLAQESLLPTSRTEFVDETGIALFIDLWVLWLSSTFVTLTGAFLLFPREFADASPAICAAVVLSAAIVPFVFGLVLTTMRFRSTWVSLWTMILLTWASVPWVLWQTATGVSVLMAAMRASVPVILGLIFVIDAARRWRRTELG